MPNSLSTLLGQANLLRAGKKGWVKASRSAITAGERLDWRETGAASDALLLGLRELYWDGVRSELMDIVRAVKEWQGAGLRDVELDDEDDDRVYGFESFIDQVSESSRQFSIDYSAYYPRQFASIPVARARGCPVW